MRKRIKKKKNEKKSGTRIHCYVDGNCDRFFDDFYNLKGLIILNMYRII